MLEAITIFSSVFLTRKRKKSPSLTLTLPGGHRLNNLRREEKLTANCC